MTTKIRIDQIHIDDDMNSRGKIVPSEVVDLAKDIERQGGLIQPVVLMRYPEEKVEETGFKYWLIAGYRRTMAHRVLKWEEIEAKIIDEYDEEEARFLNLNENLQRKDLTLMQEATAIGKVVESLREKHLDGIVPESRVMERLGASRGWVQVRMMALKLPAPIKQELASADFASQADIRDLYTVFIREGKEAADAYVRHLKDNKLREKRHKKANTEKELKPRGDSKRHRRRPELFDMQTHLREQFGNGDMTKLIAWCSGEITTDEFVNYLKETYPKYIPLETR